MLDKFLHISVPDERQSSEVSRRWKLARKSPQGEKYAMSCQCVSVRLAIASGMIPNSSLISLGFHARCTNKSSVYYLVHWSLTHRQLLSSLHRNGTRTAYKTFSLRAASSRPLPISLINCKPLLPALKQHAHVSVPHLRLLFSYIPGFSFFPSQISRLGHPTS